MQHDRLLHGGDTRTGIAHGLGWRHAALTCIQPRCIEALRVLSMLACKTSPPFSRHPQSSFNILSHKFSDHLGKIGMVRNDGLNTSLEKSHCTGPDTFITAYEHLDFHPSYNPSGPSHCRDQPL
ncbi:PREDICTED: UPF0691 protein C9orf116 homolog [Corvus brachyrhynchos]|uniref:UPF0691 protein C9orf116 homolog n=1 Tax=Corvus brachyrhynchos TaxID=85066 RepID=UPI00081672D0|nr:PREDICTED: UPF0691 protein C9orf116 homolog [Corvus brachyrhynchos]